MDELTRIERPLPELFLSPLISEGAEPLLPLVPDAGDERYERPGFVVG